MLAYDSRTKLEALRDHFETLSRAGNYLLVGSMISAIVREKAGNQIRVPAIPCGAKFFRSLARHFCTRPSLLP